MNMMTTSTTTIKMAMTMTMTMMIIRVMKRYFSFLLFVFINDLFRFEETDTIPLGRKEGSAQLLESYLHSLFSEFFSDADECNASVPVCDANAICQNTLASFHCTCKIGFTGNGLSCQGKGRLL